MKKTLVVLVAITAITCATMALAAPRALSSTELDAVSAGASGQGFLDGVLGTFLGTGDEVESAQLEDENVVASASGGIAVLGQNSRQAVAGAVAVNDGTAVNGDANLLLQNKGNVALGFSAAGQGNQVADQSFSDIAQIGAGNAHLEATNIEDILVDDGSAMVVGDHNTTHVTTDNSSVTGVIAAGGLGVIAREATIADSFNTKLTTIDVNVYIDDSFNCTTNTQDISGQCNLSAIVNANTLGNSAIGANLNLTTASATTPTSESGPGSVASVPIISGNALALTIQNQVVLNYVAVINSDITF